MTIAENRANSQPDDKEHCISHNTNIYIRDKLCLVYYNSH